MVDQTMGLVVGISLIIALVLISVIHNASSMEENSRRHLRFNTKMNAVVVTCVTTWALAATFHFSTISTKGRSVDSFLLLTYGTCINFCLFLYQWRRRRRDAEPGLVRWGGRFALSLEVIGVYGSSRDIADSHRIADSHEWAEDSKWCLAIAIVSLVYGLLAVGWEVFGWGERDGEGEVEEGIELMEQGEGGEGEGERGA